MKRTVVTTLVAIGLLFSMSGASMAVEPVYMETEQAAFEAQVANAYNAVEMTDEDVIETVISTYFDMAANIYAGLQTLDDSFILDDSPQYAACHNYFETQARKMFSKEIFSPEHEITVDSISINGNTADVTARFLFTYVYEPTETDRSGISVKYDFTLEKSNGEWLIGDIQTNSSEDMAARECGYSISGATADFSDQGGQDAAEILSPDEMVAYEREIMSSQIMPLSTKASLNRSKVASYAGLYWSRYNDKFPSFGKADCQNFASQCIWYGFGGSIGGIESHAFPMLPNWYASIDNGLVYSWTSCSNFRNTALKTSGSTTGVYGVVWEMDEMSDENSDVYYDYVSTLDVGDLVHFRWDNGDQHAMVVTKVTGTSGSRTPDDIYVSGHTTDEYNRCLADKLGQNEEPAYWAIRIMSVYST